MLSQVALTDIGKAGTRELAAARLYDPAKKRFTSGEVKRLILPGIQFSSFFQNPCRLQYS